MDKKVSIIVGLYNVSHFLKQKQLKSIFQQTYPNWELILVDDGSTDDTRELCELFAQKDNRIRVLHKENGGVGSARNEGLRIASGDYIWFYDVDDEVEKDLLSYCVEKMEEKEVDLLIFGFWGITPSMNLTKEVHFKDKLIQSSKELRKSYLDDLLFVPMGNGFACNKFYKRSVLEKYHLRYEDLKIQQDEVFNLKLYPYINRVYLSPRLLYHYYIYDIGNTRSRFIPTRFEIYKSVYNSFRNIQHIWQLKDSRFEDYLYCRFYNSIEQLLCFNLFHPDCPWSWSERKKELHRVVSDAISQETFLYMKQYVEFNFERRLYQSAFLKENLKLLRLYVKVFTLLRKIKNAIR